MVEDKHYNKRLKWFTDRIGKEIVHKANTCNWAKPTTLIRDQDHAEELCSLSFEFDYKYKEI